MREEEGMEVSATIKKKKIRERWKKSKGNGKGEGRLDDKNERQGTMSKSDNQWEGG